MGRFAAIVLLFAFAFAWIVPSDFGALAPDETERSVLTVTDDEAESDSTNSNAPESRPAMPFSDHGTSLRRGPDGQFHVDVHINGQPVAFLVDTGADEVALTVDDARRVGILVNPEQFVPVGMGAGGPVYGQRVQLESVHVVGHDIGALDAVVLNGATHNLLGQSVLRQVASLELRGDTMVIH